jgi:DNA-binding beta-propeller fold protein YncE
MGECIVFADARTRSVTGSVAVAAPRDIAFDPDGRLAYVTLAAGHLAVIDAEGFSVEGQYAVQASPDGVAVGRRPRTRSAAR